MNVSGILNQSLFSLQACSLFFGKTSVWVYGQVFLGILYFSLNNPFP